MTFIQISLLSTLAMSVVFVSCSKEKSFKKDIIGSWNANYISETHYDADQNISEAYSTLDYSTYLLQFYEDGTGSMKMVDVSGQTEAPLTWSYDHDAQILSIITEIFFEDTKQYDITFYEKGTSISLELDHTYYVPEFGLDGESVIGSYNFVKE